MAVELPTFILDALARGATALTPNQRAARTLRRAFDRAQRTAGRTTWTPANVFALDTWMAALWRTLLVEGQRTQLVLNPVQQQVLWRTAIAASTEPGLESLRSPDALADLAARAARLLELYEGQVTARDFSPATDTRAFARWHQAFTRLCRQANALTTAQLPAALHAALVEGVLTVPEQGMLLVDFDDFAPAVARLLASLESAGYPVERVATTLPAAEGQLYTAPDDELELHAAARWAATIQADVQPDQNTAPTIAMVVPDLAARRSELERVFTDVLPAGSFEFSLGRPLAHTEPVASALALLAWPLAALPLATISTLLLSPSFAAAQGPAATATLAAAEFDRAELRRQKLLRPELSLAAFIEIVRRSRRLPRLTALLASLRGLQRTAADEAMAGTTRQSHAGWADVFRKLLEASGWYAATVTDSLSWQMQQRFDSALDELATLDFFGPPPTAAEALEALQSLCAGAIFAPASHEAPIQILGPLELGGLSFDHLWFLGADDLAWPPAASPSPLLPFALQRLLGMPATQPAKDAAQAAALTQRIAHSAAQVVFSYAVQSEAGERRPSTALAPLALEPCGQVSEPTAPARLPLLTVDDSTPIAALPDRVLKGGARILELEAACPFRAFAEVRLQSAELESRDSGLDPRDRGSLVHAVMESFWAEVKSQQTLRNLPVSERHALLERSIDFALEETQSRTGSPWDAAYLDIQHLRLQQLLRPWLDAELRRPAFTVADQERSLPDIALGRLRLNLRVDRIDQTDGGRLILDYKTGAAKPAEWLTDRPEAPQLPLYAVVATHSEPASDRQLGGIAFANLRAGEDLDLQGFADSTDVLASPARMETATLAGQLDLWQQRLTSLATSFAEGGTRVDPRKFPTTCTRCGQRLLCRLDPQSLAADPDAEDEAEADSEAPAGWSL